MKIDFNKSMPCWLFNKNSVRIQLDFVVEDELVDLEDDMKELVEPWELSSLISNKA